MFRQFAFSLFVMTAAIRFAVADDGGEIFSSNNVPGLTAKAYLVDSEGNEQFQKDITCGPAFSSTASAGWLTQPGSTWRFKVDGTTVATILIDAAWKQSAGVE